MLINDIDDFLGRFRMSPTRFGREAVGDPRFVFDLRNGREPRTITATRVAGYMAGEMRRVLSGPRG